MALIVAQKIARTGLVPAFAAVAASDTFQQGDNRFLHVKNGSGSSINVTLNSVQPCNQGADHDEVVAVAAGAEKKIGPIPARFADANGIVTVTYSSITTITAGLFEL